MMIKATLRVLVVLAIANLLALVGFVGWLGWSGRLDRTRLERLHEMFRDTVDGERAAQARRDAEAADAERVLAEEARLLDLPMARSEEIAASGRFEGRAALVLRALDEEERRLEADLMAREADLADREARFGERQRDWERSIAAGADRQTNEQFRKTVRLLEAAPPKQAREWILELLETGRADVAVAYLDAMNPAKSAALMKAFKLQGDSKVATQLLDRLRTLGLEKGAGSLRADAAVPAQSPAETAGTGAGTGRAGGTAGAGRGGPTPNGSVALPGASESGARVGTATAGRR